MLLMTDCAFLSASPNGILIASAYVPPPWEIIKGIRLGLVICVTSAIIWPHEAHKHWVLLPLLPRPGWGSRGAKGREGRHQNNFGIYAQFLGFHFCISDDSHLFYCAVERIKCAIINADCRLPTVDRRRLCPPRVLESWNPLCCSDLKLYVHITFFSPHTPDGLSVGWSVAGWHR